MMQVLPLAGLGASLLLPMPAAIAVCLAAGVGWTFLAVDSYRQALKNAPVTAVTGAGFLKRWGRASASVAPASR